MKIAVFAMTLRRATMDDAQRLFDWRNDPVTRQASHSTAELKLDEHLAWLARSLEMPGRAIYIAETDGVAVGTARTDLDEGVTELSWTVAPELRGKGIGEQLVRLLIEQTPGPLTAEIRMGNAASLRIAQKVGLRQIREENSILYFSR